MSELRDTRLDPKINVGPFSCCDGNRLLRELDFVFTPELLANADVFVTAEGGDLRLRVRLRPGAKEQIHVSRPDLNQPNPAYVITYAPCPGPPPPWPPPKK